MSIDITRLLTGDAAMPLHGGLTSALSAEDFGMTLDEKMADLGLAMLPLVAGLLPSPAENQTLGEASVEAAVLETTLPEGIAAALTPESAEESPQWQLQQLVTRNAAGSERVDPETVKPAGRQSATEMLAAVVSKTGKADKPQTAEAAPQVASTSSVPVMAQASAPVVDASVNSSPPTISLNPATLPVETRASISAAPSSVATVSYPPEAPEWKHSVSQQIVMFSRNGIHNAEIRLHPEELGSLHITLRLHQEQAQVHIVSEHAQVRQAMEQAIPQLRAAMAESGVQLGQSSVSADSPFAGTDAHGEQARGDAQAHHDGEDSVADDDIVPNLLTTTPGHVYGINTFA